MDTIEIRPDYAGAGLEAPETPARLTCVIPPAREDRLRKKRGAILICPGGAYEYCSDREAEPVALRFAAAGYACFVLRYSCADKIFPTALLECAAAVKYIRENADSFSADPDKIFVMGFSAGGHLAACMANLWNSTLITSTLRCEKEDIKVNGSILCYPVILSDPAYAHEGSIQSLLTHKEYPELREYLSADRRVGNQTPPTFLWHCADDDCVPVENSLYYMAALSRRRIPFEAHIYPCGGHGLSLCDETTASCPGHIAPVPSGWTELCIRWLGDNMDK